jgi:hypothetical protein
MNKETIDCQVVMLPTEGKCRIAGKPTEKGQVPEGYRCYSHTGLLKRITKFFANGTPDPDYNTLYLNGYPNPEYNGYSEEYWHPQHLYFTSDEEIKEDDWVIWGEKLDQLSKANAMDVNLNSSYSKGAFHKVIATTNPECNLPAIPESFLKQYVAANGKIDKVRLETFVDFPYGSPHEVDWNAKYPIKLKLTAANEVIALEAIQYLEVQTPAECLKELECVGQDKELEEAANRLSLRVVAYMPNPVINQDAKIGFIDGVKWQKKQSVTEAIEFATWVMQQKFDYLVGKSYEKLYELWQKSKNK